MFKKALLIGVANLIVGFGINWLVGLLLPTVQKEYEGGLFRPWTDPLMLVFFAYPFILGFVLVYLWDKVKGNLKGDKTTQAFEFAKLYFIVATVPGMFITYTSFQISLSMVLLWTATGFLEALVAGIIISRVK